MKRQMILPMLDLSSRPLRRREEIKQVSDGIVATIVAASLCPSARTGPVAAIMLSVHIVKWIAAQDTEPGGELFAFKRLPSGSICSSQNYTNLSPKKPVLSFGKVVNQKVLRNVRPSKGVSI